MDKSQNKVNSFNNKLKSLRGPMLAVGTAMTGMGVLSIKAASDLEQSIGGIESVFGDAADEVLRFSETADKSMGLSRRAFNEAILPLSAMMKNAGVAIDDVADRTLELSQIAADLSATYGGTTKDAVDALAAAFRGEADPIERFGLSLKITDVNARAVAMGLAETTSAVNSTSRAAAFMDLVLEQTTDIQGQFAREADTVAVKVQKARASFENLTAELGENLLPIAEKVVGWINTALDWFDKLPKPVQDGTVAVAGIVGALALLGLVLSPLITVGSAVVAVIGAIAGAAAVVGAAVLIVVGIIAALGAAVFLVWKNWDWVWDNIQSKTATAVIAITGPISVLVIGIAAIGKAIEWLWNNWDEIWTAIKVVFNAVVDGIGETWDNVWDGMKSAARSGVSSIIGMVNRMIDGVETGINAIVDAINSIPDIDILGKEIGIPDVPSVTLPRIPMLAEGGIVNRPTLAMIGEAGPEAVIPLNRGNAGGGNTTINVTINGNVDSPARAEQLAHAFARKVQTYNRRGINVGVA